MADMTERLATARKKAEVLKSDIAKMQNEKKDCTIHEAAGRKDLKNLGPGLKARRVLKGHFGKVYAMHWSGDNQNLVSASQVSRYMLTWYYARPSRAWLTAPDILHAFLFCACQDLACGTVLQRQCSICVQATERASRFYHSCMLQHFRAFSNSLPSKSACFLLICDRIAL